MLEYIAVDNVIIDNTRTYHTYKYVYRIKNNIYYKCKCKKINKIYAQPRDIGMEIKLIFKQKNVYEKNFTFYRFLYSYIQYIIYFILYIRVYTTKRRVANMQNSIYLFSSTLDVLRNIRNLILTIYFSTILQTFNNILLLLFSC